LIHQGSNKRIRAQALGVSPKNIYKQSLQEVKDLRLKAAIEQVHIQHPAYGHRRVAWELGLNPKRVRRVMRKYEIKPPRRKVRGWCTKSTSHHTYINLIKDLPPQYPNHIWCSDISYLKFQGKNWYLATIQDQYTRQIIAVQVGTKHDSHLNLSVLKQGLRVTIPKIFHSDQGTEFMAKICTQYLESKNIQISVSDAASPWQNGYQESFFGRFKAEFGDCSRFETAGELIAEIYAQIRYYNHHRIHTALKMPPVTYANSF